MSAPSGVVLGSGPAGRHEQSAYLFQTPPSSPGLLSHQRRHPRNDSSNWRWPRVATGAEQPLSGSAEPRRTGAFRRTEAMCNVPAMRTPTQQAARDHRVTGPHTLFCALMSAPWSSSSSAIMRWPPWAARCKQDSRDCTEPKGDT